MQYVVENGKRSHDDPGPWREGFKVRSASSHPPNPAESPGHQGTQKGKRQERKKKEAHPCIRRTEFSVRQSTIP